MNRGRDSLGEGRYRLERRLGAGGMASVWLAHDERLDRPVAVKVMADTLAGDERWLERFRREARAAAALSHPQIVKVFDYGVEDERPYLVMQYVPGGTLADQIASGHPVDVALLARHLLDALHCVHEAGLLHRDVKPANIICDERGAHLTDFGIARPSDATALTQTGAVMGTLRYLAPEVAAGKPASTASDLYAAGVVLREAGGRPPRSLAQLIETLTANDPGARPPSAQAALQLLEPDEAQAATARTRVLADTQATRTMPPTAPTRRLPGTNTRGSGTQTTIAIAGRRISTPALAAGVAMLAALVILIATLTGGDSSPPSVAPPPQAAPAGAPLSDQLRALDRIIDHAAAR